MEQPEEKKELTAVATIREGADGGKLDIRIGLKE